MRILSHFRNCRTIQKVQGKYNQESLMRSQRTLSPTDLPRTLLLTLWVRYPTASALPVSWLEMQNVGAQAQIYEIKICISTRTPWRICVHITV